jgi:DNA-binding MarR family transcriptional regulator
MPTRYDSPWPLWLRAHQTTLDAVEADLAGADLPPLSWYDVLWSLEQAEDGKLRMAELADEMLLTRSNATRLIDRLEKAGLIRREPCDTDKRGCFTVLTEEGRALRERMWPVYRQAIDRHFASLLSAEEREVLQRVFRRLGRA